MGAIVGAVLSLICFSFVWGVAVPQRSSGFDALIEVAMRWLLTGLVGMLAGAAIAASRPIRGWLSVAIVLTLGVVGGVLNGLAVRDLLVAGCHPSLYRAPIYPEWCGASGVRPFLGIFAKSALAGGLVAAALMAVGIRRPPLK
jgi:hypothetical protein